MRPSNKKTVLMLDRNYYPIKAISWRRAMGKLYGDGLRAEVLCGYEDAIGEFDPAVIRLVNRMIPSHQMRRKPRLTRKAILARDGHTCQYCGRDKRSTLTVDHVIPRSRGGKHTFENCTTACLSCNQDKADYLLEEWGVEIITIPTVPILDSHIGLLQAPNEWKIFIY